MKMKQGMLGMPVVYDQAMRQAAYHATHDAIGAGDFAGLERMHDEFVRARLRTTDGLWMLSGIASALDEAVLGTTESTDRLIADWRARLPDSKLRPIAEAAVWNGRAWKARGSDFASVVPPEAMQIFREQLQRAAEILDASAATSKESPLWYWMALNIAGARGAPRAESDALFRDAIGRFPTYLPLYQVRVRYLRPEWGGSYEQIDRLAADAVEATRATDGESFYARVYVLVGRSMHSSEDLFGGTAVSWPRMKRSFDDLAARYPTVGIRNLYATFACRARDKETTARLLRELGNAARLGDSSKAISTESCVRFAFAPG